LLLLRGMRWRLGLSLLMVLTSAIAVGAAVLGPLYLWTAGDSLVRTTLASAAVEARGATISPALGQAGSLDQIRAAERGLARAGGLHHWYGAPITSVLSGVLLAGPRSGLVRSQLFFRTGICHVLRFQAGDCNLGPRDVAISERSARELGMSVGSVVHAHTTETSRPLRLRITGIYAVPNLRAGYWWGNGPGYFPFGQTTGMRGSLPAIDSLIASTTTALAVPPQDATEIIGQLPLRLADVGLGQEGTLRRVVTEATSLDTSHGVALTTGLPFLLTNADRQRHVMATIVAVAAVELVLLAIWVLTGLLVRSGDARRSEIRVARLRGFPALSLLAATVLEPALLCGLGLVLGVGSAVAAVVTARDKLLDPSAVVSFDVWVFAALGITVLAIAGALVVGTVRLLRTSALTAAPPIRVSSQRTSYIFDALLLALSVVAVIALATNGSLSGHSNPIASAAPGLIALGTAVIAVELVLFACRVGVSASAGSNRIAIFLALRQIVRRPAVMRQTRVLVIALGLACFAVAAWSVARTNRASAAMFTVGTNEVATVTPHGVGLEQAVERVDPRGHFAMSAVEVTTPSSTVLAVDASRLSSTLAWPRGISPTTLGQTARLLRPPSAPAVSLSEGGIRLVGSAAYIGPNASLRGIDVSLWVFNPQVGTAVVNLGALRAGASTYVGSLAGLCPGGCRLVGLGLVPAPFQHAPSSGTVRFTVASATTCPTAGRCHPLAAALYPRGWRTTEAGVRISRSAIGGLTLTIPASAVGFGTLPMASVADHPQVLPGAVTSELQSISGGAAAGNVLSSGLDGNAVNVGFTVTASALPRVGGDAAMVDLKLLSRFQVNPTSPYAADEVWLGPRTPSDAIARLERVGLHVDRVQRESAVFQQLERSGPALADDFLLVATAVALLAAAASTLAALGANTRERATELTALEVGGVPRPVLARSLALESAALAITALFGAGAGVLAAAMAIPALPELGGPASIPLQYRLPGGAVVAVSAAVIAVIALAGTAVSVILIERMSPTLLRSAPNDSPG
jgi:putative ABC transport system permease protein